jgi:hypothetical protein
MVEILFIEDCYHYSLPVAALFVIILNDLMKSEGFSDYASSNEVGMDS